MSANFTLVCCVRRAFQKLLQTSGFSTQTVSILSNRFFLLCCGKSKLVQCKVCVSKPTRVVFETRQPVCVGKSKYDSRVPKRLIRCTVFIAFCATFSQHCFVKKRFVVFAKSSFSKITADKRFFNTNSVHFVQPFFLLRCGKSKFAQRKVCVSKPPSLNSSNRRQCTKRQCTYFNFYLFTLVRFNLCLFTLVCLNIVLFVLWFCLQEVVAYKGHQFPDHCVRNSFGVTPYCFLNCRLK